MIPTLFPSVKMESGLVCLTGLTEKITMQINNLKIFISWEFSHQGKGHSTGVGRPGVISPRLR